MGFGYVWLHSLWLISYWEMMSPLTVYTEIYLYSGNIYYLGSKRGFIAERVSSAEHPHTNLFMLFWAVRPTQHVAYYSAGDMAYHYFSVIYIYIYFKYILLYIRILRSGPGYDMNAWMSCSTRHYPLSQRFWGNSEINQNQ